VVDIPAREQQQAVLDEDRPATVAKAALERGRGAIERTYIGMLGGNEPRLIEVGRMACDKLRRCKT
jgi:hypothetical protein